MILLPLMLMMVYNRTVMSPQKPIFTEHKTSRNVYYHTNVMSSIIAIGTNHAKVLTGLRDSRLYNKLAKSKAKRWINMGQVLQDVVDMAINFKRSRGYSLLTLNVNHVTSSNNYSSLNSYRSIKPPKKVYNNHQ